MKKKIAAVILAVMGFMGLMLLGGCDMFVTTKPGGVTQQQTPLEKLTEQYGKVGEAKGVSEHIEIASGALLQYESSRTYTKTGSGYTVTGTVKRLNDLTHAEAYSEEAVSGELPAGSVKAQLDLKEVYFTTVTVTETGLEGTVRGDGLEALFGLSGELPAQVYGMTVKLTADGTHVTGIEVKYTSGSSAVTITLGYTY